MLYKTKKSLGSLRVLLICVILCATLCAISFIYLISSKDATFAEDSTDNEIYWGVTTDDNEYYTLVLGGNQSDLDGISAGDGTGIYSIDYEADGRAPWVLDNHYFNPSPIKILAVEIKSPIRPTEMEHWFAYNYFTSTEDFKGLENLDTSLVTSMAGLFTGCDNLREIDLSTFDTRSLVNMNMMFDTCSALQRVNISSFDATNVLYTNFIFSNSNILSEIHLPAVIGENCSFDLERNFWNGSGDISTATSADSGKTLIRHTSHSIEHKDAKAATCTESGNIDCWTCSICKKCFSENGATNEIDATIAPLEHSWGEWTVTKTASETEIGEEQRICSRDNSHVEKREIPKTYDIIYWGVVSEGSDKYNKLILSSDPQDIVGIVDGVEGGTITVKFSGSISVDSMDTPWIDLQKRYTNVEFSIVDIKSKLRPIYMRNWFRSFSGNSIDLSKIDTSRTVDMSSLFYYCDVTSLDLSGFDTSVVTDMSEMFYYCEKLTAIDVSGFNTSRVTNMSEMFCRCYVLTSLDLSTFDTAGVTNMSGMFKDTEALNHLDLSSFNTSSVTNMSEMFKECGLTSIDLSAFNTSSVTDMNEMFKKCAFTSIDLSNFDTGSVVDMSSMFESCKALTSIDVSNFDTGSVTNFSAMFFSCNGLTSIDLSCFDTKNAEMFNNMFCWCEGLTSIDVSNFDLRSAIDISGLFSHCANLQSIVGLDKWNTSSIESMNALFDGCVKLSEIDLSAFDTSNVIAISHMFWDCASLTYIDLAHFDLSQVDSFIGTFGNCTSLKEVDLSNNFTNGSTPANICDMFSGCSAIEYINLSGLAVCDSWFAVDDVLEDCDNLKKIVMPNITVTSQEIALPGLFWNGVGDISVATYQNSGQTLLRHDTHSIEHHPFKDATCEENGNTEYWYCTVCQKYFSNDTYTDEITDSDSVIINAIGHEWSQPTYSWDGKDCTAKRVCAHDSSHIDSETVTASVEVEVSATCTQGGKDKYTADFVSPAFETQTAQADSSALGHEYGEWTVTKKATFDEYGEEQRVCLHDGSHIETRQTPKRFDYRWIIIAIVLSIIIIGEVAFLIGHKVRADRKEDK
ncbi:MAG: DUF285 domain-containing protein [Clostridia bacterium]|nr:DUF285 domain-containing protein [Clostridia bacterium]